MCTHSHTHTVLSFRGYPSTQARLSCCLEAGGPLLATWTVIDSMYFHLEEALLICHPPPFIHVILCSSLHNRKNKFNNNTLREAAAFCLRWEWKHALLSYLTPVFQYYLNLHLILTLRFPIKEVRVQNLCTWKESMSSLLGFYVLCVTTGSWDLYS